MFSVIVLWYSPSEIKLIDEPMESLVVVQEERKIERLKIKNKQAMNFILDTFLDTFLNP